MYTMGDSSSLPLRTFFNNSKTAQHKETFSLYFYTSVCQCAYIDNREVVVIKCCHGHLLFPVCRIIFGVGWEDEQNLNVLQNNGLVILKFGAGKYF